MALPPENWITIQHNIRQYSEVQHCKEELTHNNYNISIEEYERLKNLRDLLLSQTLTPNDHDRIINELYYGGSEHLSNRILTNYHYYPSSPVR
eukprot:UN08095